MGSSLMNVHTHAALRMIALDPGIRRSRLYASEQDARRLDELRARGFIVQEGEGYILTEAGKGLLRAFEGLSEALGVPEDVLNAEARLRARYNRRVV